ncbi:6774_t:CDS:2 [Entrophospora sp. SA101]|nr:6774_t:CDS:2 [Entrophospora sp. SA101]
MLFRWHFNLEQKRSLEVCTTFRASDFINKNNNNGTEKNEGGKDKGEVLFHRRAYYISKPLDFKNLPEPTNYYNRTFINGVNNNNNLDNYNLRPNLKTGSDTSLHRQKSAETFKSNESFIHHNVNLEQLRTPSMIESGRTAIYTDLLKRKQKAADRFFFYIEPDNSAATIIECELSPKKFDDDKQDIINEKHYADYDDYNDNYEDYEDPLMDEIFMLGDVGSFQWKFLEDLKVTGLPIGVDYCYIIISDYRKVFHSSSFDFSKDLVPYGHIMQEEMKNTKFRLSFSFLIYNFDSLDMDTLTVILTGGGKTLICAASALLFKGLTVVFTPLKSLMEDQLDLNSSKLEYQKKLACAC